MNLLERRVNIGAVLGAAGISINPLGGRFSPLYIGTGIIIAGVRAGAIVLGRFGNLISGYKVINSGYIRIFRGIGALG